MPNSRTGNTPSKGTNVPPPLDDETPPRGTKQTASEVKAEFSRDEHGMKGSLRLSSKAIAGVGGALLMIGSALGWATHEGAAAAKEPPALESRIVALEVERTGDDKRIDKLERLMSDLDRDVRKLLEQRANGGK